MSVEWCKTCGELIFVPPIGRSHVCPPEWEVVCDEYDPDLVLRFHAHDAQSAVQKWAKNYDGDGDPPTIANGMGDVEMIVRVRRLFAEGWETWKVTGEWVAQYYAERAT